MDKRKIALMSKLAIYDKNIGEADREVVKYFRQDYIYKKNMKTRLYVIIGCLIIMLFYWFNAIVTNQVDLLTLDYKAELIKLGWWMIIVLLIYSLINGIKAALEYAEAQRRRVIYLKMLKKLDNMSNVADAEEDADEAEEEFEEASNDGAGFADTRNHS